MSSSEIHPERRWWRGLLIFLVLAVMAAGVGFIVFFPNLDGEPSDRSKRSSDRDPQGGPKNPRPPSLTRKELQIAGRMLEVGSPAPELTLPSLTTGDDVNVGKFRDIKPVVLAFSSLSCDIFCTHLKELEELYQKYKDR